MPNKSSKIRFGGQIFDIYGDEREELPEYRDEPQLEPYEQNDIDTQRGEELRRNILEYQKYLDTLSPEARKIAEDVLFGARKTDSNIPRSSSLLEKVRSAAKKKYVERYDRYDRASIAKWLAGVLDRSAQEQEDAQDVIDEISDSEDPKKGQAFAKLLKDHINNQNHIMTWTLKQLDDLPNLAKKPTPEAKSDAAIPEAISTAPAPEI